MALGWFVGVIGIAIWDHGQIFRPVGLFIVSIGLGIIGVGLMMIWP